MTENGCLVVIMNLQEDRLFLNFSASKKAVYEIDPSTICQCTGLNDKSGRRIFENDILSGHIDVEFPEDETKACRVA